MEHKLIEAEGPAKYLKVKKFVHTTINPRNNEPVSHNQECVMRPDSIAALVYRPQDQKFIWVEQFRVGPGTKEPENPTTVEPVAGMVDGDEPPIETARREIGEEIGLKVTSIIALSHFYMCPGIMNERMHLFFATVDDMDVADIGGLVIEHEFLKIHVWSAEETQQAMDDGRMNNAHAMILWQWAQLQGLAPIKKVDYYAAARK